MTFRELQDRIKFFNEEQLDQQVPVFIDNDDETAHILDSIEISDEDIYWEHHGDCIGNLDAVKETFEDKWEEEQEDLVKQPKGTVTLHTT